MKSSLVYLTLGGLLAAAVGVAIYTWDQMGDVSLSAHGIVALVLGVVASLALGIGLMALVFYSHRKGYDRIDGTPPVDKVDEMPPVASESDADENGGTDAKSRTDRR